MRAKAILILLLATMLRGGELSLPAQSVAAQASAPDTLRLLDQLEGYGIAITRNDMADPEATLAVFLAQIETLAQGVRTAIQRSVSENGLLAYGLLDVPPGPQDAFQRVFGRSVVEIYEGPFIPYTDFLGRHTGNQIHLAGSRLERGGVYSTDNTYRQRVVTISGLELIAHEFAHSLTWRAYFFQLSDFDETQDYANTMLGVNVGEYAYGVERLDLYAWQAEVTADAIASWALGQDRGGATDDFMRQVLASLQN
ncbi:MAG: hypothetical protein GYB68_14320 [Chloroflexi bacterium]|nr:hypothetical protein [Chloroflexota bacterium]